MRLSTAIFSLACALCFSSAGVKAYPFNFVPANATIEECGPDTDLLKIEYVNLSPNPPEKGKVLTIDAKGLLSGPIVEGAVIDVVAKVGVIKLLTKKFDFCEESVKVDKPCPVASGEQYLQHSVELPKEIPPGKYVVNIQVHNPDGQQVTCLLVKAQFLIK
ncbi:Phosphatidylglycerol/phosphatidylinositol transfer protein [Entomortierella beljakovae]|nr:Phosphatidylglycerol/phosphatidylinositol transfer protein [Entomortierella beljakovae]